MQFFFLKQPCKNKKEIYVTFETDLRCSALNKNTYEQYNNLVNINRC